MIHKLSDADYAAHADFRYALRRFLRFSEEATRRMGMTTQKYQALLAIRSFPSGERITIGALAERLQVRKHSAVEIVDRLEAQYLVRREFGTVDRRLVNLELTPQGTRILERLVEAHREELHGLWPELELPVQRLLDQHSP